MGSNLWITLRRIRNLSKLLKDSNQPFFKKFLIIFGIIYLLSPLDLVPEPIFGFGFLDDLILWAVLLSWLSESLDSYSIKDKLFNQERKKPFSWRNPGTEVYEGEARIIEDEDEGEDEQEDPSERKETK